MGASESTAKSNGTTEDEEEECQQRPAGASIAARVVVAGVAAWRISRMLSDDTDSQHASESTPKSNGTTDPAGASIAAAAVGVAVAGVAAWGILRMLWGFLRMLWGISRSMLSDGTHSQQKMKFGAEPSCFSSSNIPSGRFKVETSRACKPKERPGVIKRGPSGYGGILRDGRGNWVKGFRGFIGESDSLTAEFYGILKGLQLLDKHGLVDSILESDYKPAVDWIIEEDRQYPGHSKVIDKDRCWEIIEECKRLKNKNRIKVDYRPREYKKSEPTYLYKLARIAISERVSYVEIMTPPDGIS